MYVVFKDNKQVMISDYFSLVEYLKDNKYADSILNTLKEHGCYTDNIFSTKLIIIEPETFETIFTKYGFPKYPAYLIIEEYMKQHYRNKKVLNIIK